MTSYAVNSQNIHYSENPSVFFDICSKVLNNHAPRKKTYIRGNSKPFMTKELSKTIMQRTGFRTNF